MAWCWAFLVLLLAFGVKGEDLCATSASSFCHPNRMNAYIECKQGRDVVSTCPDGLSWSLKIRACVNRMLSECAASFERKTKKALASLCDTQPTLEIGSTFSYRCHPDDASQFVICPPNSVYANIGRCPENRQFSLSDAKCLAGRTTDCARALDGPEAGNIERAREGTPTNITSDADLEAANITSENVPVTLNEAEYFATSIMGQNRWDYGPKSAFRRGPWPWRSQPGAGFPQTVHVLLPFGVTVIGFSFRSPKGMGSSQSPTMFDFIGSNNCRSWTVILRVFDVRWRRFTNFEEMIDLGDEKKLWHIPINQQGSYRCYGFRVHATRNANNVSIYDAKLWRKNPNRRG